MVLPIDHALLAPPRSVATSHVANIKQIVQEACATMARAQQAWKVHYNCCHTAVEYQVRDAVLLSTCHSLTVGSRKLMPCFFGPFCIIGKQVYEVWLPPTMAQIHPVFHVSQVKLSPMDTGE